MSQRRLLTERVRHSRIKIAIAAWAYENNHRPIMTDAEYDALSYIVDETRNIATGNYRLDRFFQRNFNQHSGLWIHKHPEQSKLENLYARYYQKRRKR